MQRAEDQHITVARPSGFVGVRDIFAQVVQDDGPAGAREWSDGLESFVERFAGDEPSGEAVPRSEAANPTSHRFLGGEPEDQIAQRIRRRIRPFVGFAVENLTEHVRMAYPALFSLRSSAGPIPWMEAVRSRDGAPKFKSEHSTIRDVF
jgi:hypothetical protein